MAGTILRLGWTNPQTGAFGAHPLLGEVIDLNDGVTFTLLDEALELAPPAREVALSGNARTQGERASRALYRHNRLAHAQVTLGPMASYNDLATTVRYLTRWLDAPPATPICLQWQPPSATAPVYLDIVGAAHALPADERDWLRLQIEPVELVFVVRPGLRGDRVTLSNLVVNPGFEAPSGPGIVVFADSFANANAYTLQSGPAPTLAGNVLTLGSGTTLGFGSPAWGAINTWRLRFQHAAGLAWDAILHGSGNNTLYVNINGATVTLNQNIGGTLHTFATAAAALTAGSWYWLTVTQFPAAPGTPPDLQATMNNDSGGSLGSAIGTTGPVPTFDALTALSGAPSILSGGTLNLGGAFPNVHTLSLFGPGGWAFSSTDGTSGVASGAWEQNTANTYPGGAVASFGAARLDAAPAGTLGALWVSYGGGAPAGTSAIPIAPSQTVGLAAWVKSAGVSAGCAQTLLALEFDASGSFLRSGTVASATGPQAAWTQLSGSYTTGASCAYLGVRLEAADTTAGASANGTVWFDNIQCWNITTTGQSSMPYCELRFPQSPAQLLLTGLLGDLPSPALLAWGTYLTSWATGATLTYALGRRGRSDGTAAAARLVGGSHGYYGTAIPPQATAILDASAYGGSYPTLTLTSSGWNVRAFSAAPSDCLGSYHLLARFWTAETAGNLPNVQARVVTQQRSEAWWGEATQTDQLGAGYTPFVAPLSSSSTWTLADAGQVSIPPLPSGALTDLTQHYVTPRPQWVDNTGGGAAARCNAQLLLPIDGSLVMGLLNNPSNAPFAVTNQWLWVYHDGLLLNRAAVGDAAASTYSLEAAPIPNPQQAGGGPGTSSTGVINVNSGADPALILDPTLSLAAIAAPSSPASAAGGSGVNQLAGVVSDNAGAVLPLYAEIQYSPLYLYPR